MADATAGDTVRVHYTGRFDDGTVFDTSDGREPLEFTLGEGQVIAGFEQAVEGLSPGSTTKATIDATSAYGERREELLFQVDRARFPEGVDPAIGDQLELKQPEGGMVEVIVGDIQGDTITLDANHPLAGRSLNFDIELVEIVEVS
ncbi:MAG: peptidylprolyl isomerase [Gemmatimonadetes bacterium]|jgi:peptidylprolyl isomerase|nr:peptidylprolyl isomerase [Gemmatimonadota bacterium]MBT6147731.1 peptidylprolyl isomerase [Gemmatimonadota bacterium]MBT7862543.1 peptidylprolyl isomerase [Gemmatimonadota bacterium]